MAEAQSGGLAFQGVNAVGSGYIEAAALRAQADFEKKVTELNNKGLDYEVGSAEAQARDAISRGEKAVLRREQQARLQAGAQRAAMGANGSFNPEVMAETESMAAADEASLHVNAFREAFGYRTKANQIRGQQAANEFQTRTRANALEYGAKSSMITGWTEGIGYGLQSGAAADKASKSRKLPKEGGYS